MMTKSTSRDFPQENEQEALSALLDGELTREQARQTLRRLRDDADMRARLAEYCAVGDALRGLCDGPVAPDLTLRVMHRLEREPTLLAPMRATPGRRPGLWLAAAVVVVITWGVWSRLPEQGPALPLAAHDAPPMDVQPYLAAHQDFAQAVIAPAEMQFTRVSLTESRP
ncbi:MAG TPA: sigma-E factor negative regulatory protein [Thiobacillaceae bacterium]|nr:sigma-E factor negative regulatory protein [Thiobacillaceae bacterium]HNU64251.1 sigma-E factor negative regulatory protein [Thiobacillaceae bacterium]